MTLTTIRPSSDVKLVNTNSTAGDASSVLDDTPDVDGSYVHAPDGKDINHGAARFRVNLTNLGAVSTTQRIKACRFRARIRLNASGGGRTAFVSADFRWVDSVNGTFNEKYGTSSSTTFATRTGNWRVAPPRDATTWQNRANKYSAPPEWTKSIVDRIHAYLQWFYASNTTHVNCRLSELFVDVDIRDRGTLATPTVTGFGTSTRPLISWDFTENGDGDRQKKYRVKVYSQAQYSAAGFNENTSIPTWDSGVLSGTADGIAVGKDLRNGVTYKAYVAVAQDFNGRDWWTYQPYTNAKPGTKTAWATSTAFTITLTEPPTPTIEVTADTSLPWLRNLIKVTSGINLLTQNQASVETDTTGFISSLNCAIARSTAQAAHGAASLSLTSSASGDMQARTSSGSTGTPVKPGQVYTAVCSFRAAVSARTVRTRIRWLDAAGATIADVDGTSVTDSTSAWTPSTCTATAPATAVGAEVMFRVLATGAASEVHYVDMIDLHAGTSTTWSIGGLAGQALAIIEYNWATIGQKNLIAEQLWSGGDKERSTDGFYLVSPTVNALAWDQSQRYHGQGSIRWDVWDATTGIRLQLGWVAGLADLEPAYALAAVPSSAGVVYNGASGGYVDTPDTGVLDITGDIDLRARVSLADWTPATNNWIISKIPSTGTQKSYGMYIDTTGTINLQFSADGSTALTRGSTLPTGFADGSAHWVRAVLDVNNGAAGHDAKFYVSEDGSNWTQLGTTVTTAGTTSIFSSTTPLEIGSRNGGTQGMLTGTVWEASVRNGIDGTIVTRPTARTEGMVDKVGGLPYTLHGSATVSGTSRAYSFSIRMRSSTAITVRVELQPFDKDGNAIGSPFAGTNTALTTAWQELKVEDRAMPPGTVWVRPTIVNVNGTAGLSVWLDAPIWVLSAAVPAVLPMAGGSGIATDFKPCRGSDTESEATLITVASGDGGVYLFDQEVPPGYTVTYRAWTFSPEGESLPALASPFSGYVQTMLDPPQEWILSTVSAFWVDRMLVDVSEISESQHKEQQAFYPLRPVMPGILNQSSVVITDFIGGYDGTLTIGAINEEDWTHLREIISSSVAFLIHPYHGARYVSLLEPQVAYAGRTNEAHSSLNGETCEDTWRRNVTVPFQEIGRPA